MKCTDIRMIEVSEGEEIEKGSENLFKYIIASKWIEPEERLGQPSSKS